MSAFHALACFFRRVVGLGLARRPPEPSFDTAPDTAFWGTYTPAPTAAPAPSPVHSAPTVGTASVPDRAQPEHGADEPAVQPRLRTLEEVRSDLARLRERTKAQHAAAEARRDLSFAPTDFMDFADTPAARAEAPASGFAPTDFLDFGNLNLRPGR